MGTYKNFEKKFMIHNRILKKFYKTKFSSSINKVNCMESNIIEKKKYTKYHHILYLCTLCYT